MEEDVDRNLADFETLNYVIWIVFQNCRNHKDLPRKCGSQDWEAVVRCCRGALIVCSLSFGTSAFGKNFLFLIEGFGFMSCLILTLGSFYVKLRVRTLILLTGNNQDNWNHNFLLPEKVNYLINIVIVDKYLGHCQSFLLLPH